MGALVQVGGELRELGAERVAGGDHAERTAILDHRDVTELALVHEVQRVAEAVDESNEPDKR